MDTAAPAVPMLTLTWVGPSGGDALEEGKQKQGLWAPQSPTQGQGQTGSRLRLQLPAPDRAPRARVLPSRPDLPEVRRC